MIPADAVLVHENHQLVIDESSITGESESVKKGIDSNPFLLSGTKILDVTWKSVNYINPLTPLGEWNRYCHSCWGGIIPWEDYDGNA